MFCKRVLANDHLLEMSSTDRRKHKERSELAALSKAMKACPRSHAFPLMLCSPSRSYARLPGATLCVRCVAGVARCVTGNTGGCNSSYAEAPSPGTLLCFLL